MWKWGLVDLNGREIERAFLMKKVHRKFRQIIQPRKQLSDFKLGTIFMFYNQFIKLKDHFSFWWLFYTTRANESQAIWALANQRRVK